MATYNNQGPSSQILRLQDEITREVNGDAQHLADSVFGKQGDMPDIARVPDTVLDNRYRNAYQNGDRKWLLSEAQRDPEQFIKVARRIGVQLPEELGQKPMPLSGPPPPLPPPAPVAAPAPMPSPPGVVPAPVMVSPPPMAPLPQTVPMSPSPQALPGPVPPPIISPVPPPVP